MTEHRCTFCDKEIETLTSAYRRVTGWTQPRKQGGANAIALREETGELAHPWCIDREIVDARANVHRDQVSLL